LEEYLNVIAINLGMAWKVHTLLKGDCRTYVTFPLLLLSIPLSVKALLFFTSCQELEDLWSNIGFFYSESLMIFIIFLLYYRKERVRIPKQIFILSLIVFFLLVFSLVYHHEFGIKFLGTGGEAKEFIKRSEESEEFWYKMYKEISFNSSIHGFLGILMGLICVHVAFLGYLSNLSGESIDTMKTLLLIITLLSTIISITVLGLQDKELYRTTRLVYNIGILLLVPLIYTFGCLSCKKSSADRHVVFFISLLVSFCLGFVYGYLFVPLTGIRFLEVEIFVPSLNYYTFSAFMSLLIGVISYLLSFPHSGLSKGLKEFLYFYSGSSMTYNLDKDCRNPFE